MTKGRKKLPDEIKRRSGETRPSRMSGDIPIFDLVVQMPPPPEYMNETGKKVYDQVVRSMINLGLVNNNNLALLVSYAHMIGIHVEAEEAMKTKGRYMPIKDFAGNIVKAVVAPHHRISMDALDRALRIGSEFGLTPSAQTKIMSLVKNVKEKNDDDFS